MVHRATSQTPLEDPKLTRTVRKTDLDTAGETHMPNTISSPDSNNNPTLLLATTTEDRQVGTDEMYVGVHNNNNRGEHMARLTQITITVATQ